MNEVNSVTKSDSGLDRTTRWILVSGLAAVVIGAGIGAICLLTGPDSTFWFLERGWWVVTGGGLLCAIGGCRAARCWSKIGQHTTSGTIN